MTEKHNNERLKRIKEDNINRNINHDVEASIINMIMNPNKEWIIVGTQENPLSNITKLQNT